MPKLTGEDGALVIIPEGDTIFFAGEAEGLVQLCICQPGGKRETGEICYDHVGKSTADLGTLVRIGIPNMKVATIIQEALTFAMMKLQGLPLRDQAPPVPHRQK